MAIRHRRGASPTPASAASVAPPQPARSAAVSAGDALDLNHVVERWDEVVSAIRSAGKSVAATALEHAAPAAVNARGDVTLALDEANPIYAQAIEAVKAVKLEDLKQFHRAFYGASNATAAIAGDFDLQQVLPVRIHCSF